MAFARRRRRFNGLWLPTVGFEYTGLQVPSDGSAVQDVRQILSGDEPFNASTAPTFFAGAAGGLALAARQSLLVKRIVGKLDIAQLGGSRLGDAGQFNPVVYVTAGVFVDRVDQTGQLLNIAAWAANQEEGRQKRWLFQRSWIVAWNGTGNDAHGNNPSQSQVNDGSPWPQSTSWYNGSSDSHHIDIKSKARISYEERLWLMLQAQCIEPNAEIDSTLGIITNFRVFGTPTSRGNR